VLPLLPEVRDVHEGHAGLDQSSREQQVLAAHLARHAQLRAVASTPAFADLQGSGADAVALAHPHVFAANVQGAAQGAGTEQLKGPVVKPTSRGRRASFRSWPEN